MATTQTPEGQKIIVKEMSWDPITRIVGSLGIHTEIDFTNQQVLKCYSTSMVFRGFDIFMKGIDPRDAHFITSRICGICGDNHCTCSCLNQNMAYGVKPPALGDYAYNLAESADFMFDHAIFNDCMANVDFCEQMVKETNPTLLKTAENTPSPHSRHPRLQDDRRHHAGAQPVHRQLLPRDAAGGALHARDVLPLRRPPHAPVDDHAGRRLGGHHAPDLHGLLRAPDALHRVRQAHRADARRPVRLLPAAVAGLRHGGLPRHRSGLLGLLRRSRLRRLQLQGHDRVGAAPLHHARPRLQGRADHDGSRRDQPRDAHPARQLVLRRLVLGGDVRHEGPARQPRRQASPVEQDDAAEAAEARLHRQVQLGHVAAHVRQAQRHLRGLRHRRRPVRAPVGHGQGRASSTSAISRPRATASRWCCRRRPRCPRWSSSGTCPRSRTPSSAIARARTTRPTRRSSASTASRRRWPRSAPAAPRAGTRSRCPTTPSASASTRPPAACSRTTW